MDKLEIIEADLSNEEQAETIVYITNEYAKDPMGLGKELPVTIRETLIEKIKSFPVWLSLLAFFDNEPAGIANCVYSFSTFNAAKVLNVHDLAVLKEFRGKGIGEALLEAVEQKAIETDCCKVTLEVREDNRARNLYERMGFEYGRPKMFFMSKYL